VRPISLIWGLRTTDDVRPTDELSRLAAHHNFDHHITVSRPPAAGRRYFGPAAVR